MGMHVTKNGKKIYVGKWRSILECDDPLLVLRELRRIASAHPLVRLNKFDGVISLPADGLHEDLVQTLYTELFAKKRFEHYLESEMTDLEIEAEISKIELQNILTSQLRKRYPTSYRLARRISALVQSSSKFAPLSPKGRCRLGERLYGLASWKSPRRTVTQDVVEESMEDIPVRPRNLRRVGCTGDVQIIISNKDLEALLVEILSAVGGPLVLQDLRRAAMSRLSYNEVELSPMAVLSRLEDTEAFFEYSVACEGLSPEQEAVRKEQVALAGSSVVDNFWSQLSRLAGAYNRDRQLRRLYQVIWLCYLSDEPRTQLQVAEIMGVSDSLVSAYRKGIERVLKSLPLSDLEEGDVFSLVLGSTIRARWAATLAGHYAARFSCSVEDVLRVALRKGE